MKKIVLIAVMLSLITAPCLAQDEINGGVFLENTAWDFLALPGYSIGFYSNDIYLCEYGYCHPALSSIIVELLIVSIFSSNAGDGYTISGFANPLIGFGMCRICGGNNCISGVITKTSNCFF
jgi:hypothetical protein